MNQDADQTTTRIPTPKKHKHEMYAVVDQVLGGSRMNVVCGDGKSRLARIPGGKKRSIKRIRSGDLVIIRPWDIQDEKADVVLRYRPYQARILSKRHLLPSEIDVF